MVAVVIGSGVVFLDSTVVNVALPRIGDELESPLLGTLEAQTYVYVGYLLTLSALLILAGALSDRYGRRRMFLLGMAGFGITSLMCGIAPTMELLIAFRILQGAMGALLVPGSLSIIRSTFVGEEQGKGFGIWAGASAATTILGPFVGGILVDTISWRAAFLINVPLTLLGIYATVRYVAESRDEEAEGRLDWVGAIVVALAVGGLTFGAIRGQEQQWQDSAAFIALGVGALATILLPVTMLVKKNPLVPTALFRYRNFNVTNISTFLIYAALYLSSLFGSIYIQGTLGYTATGAGVSFIPATLFLVFFSTRFGALAARYGPRLFMTTGPVIMGLGLAWLLRVPADSAPWAFNPADLSTYLPSTDYLVDFLPAWILFGIGLMVMVAPLTTALMTSVPERFAGIASAFNNAISRVGPTLAGALIFIAVTAVFYNGLAARVPDLDVADRDLRAQVPPLNAPGDVSEEVVDAARESSTTAFRVSMGLAALLLFLGAAVNAVGIRNEQLDLPEPEEIQAAPVPEVPPVPGSGSD